MSEPTSPATVCAVSIAAAMTLVIAVATPAWPQSQPPLAAPKTVIIQAAPAAAPEPVAPGPVVGDPPVPPAPRENPGLINELGKMFNSPTWSLPALPVLPSMQLPYDSNEALPRLNTMVKGRMVCPVSANGAPDCKAGSDKLCQSKGFKEGKSLDTDSALSCSAKSLMGAKKIDDICRTENYVIRALCQ
jgi:hypothetical protein